MARLSVCLLGPFRVTLDGEPVTRFESSKVRALLAYLAVEADRPHHRQVLAGLLWPEWPEATARSYLRNALADLRQAIDDHHATPPHLLVSRTTIQFDLSSDCWVDVQAYQSLLGADRVEEAVGLYQGSFLEGLSVGDSPAFEDWALLWRERLERETSMALHRLAVDRGERGDWERARAYAQRQVGLEPWNEGAHQLLMRALALAGQRSAALAQYEACRRALREELDVEPGPETARLHEQIRDGTLAPAGETATAQRARPAAHNLPASPDPLIGRGTELAQLEALLREPGCRLVTLTGPGGSGKTRLALEVARQQVGNYRDGVHFVRLAGVGSVEAIVPTVAEAIGAPLYGAEEPLEQLLEHLRGQEMLLVLDNCEHLLGGVGVVAAMLEAAAAVKVLVTSRARLGMRYEQLYPVGGLELPAVDEEPEEIAAHSAVQLFLAGARRVQPGFGLAGGNAAGVERICRVVDGMPLAVLLAAAWVALLAPDEIAAQIEQDIDLLEADWQDVPARQQSMRAVFEHSWQLLSERERAVMGALSVFRGRFAREAAQDVAGASLRDLRALVDRSLLHVTGAGRYEVHELLRQFAAEKLCLSSSVGEPDLDDQTAKGRGRACLTIAGKYCKAAGERHCAAVRDRHCAYYAEFLSQREDDVIRGYVEETMREIDNIRAAWDWAVRAGKAEEVRTCSVGLWLVYNSMGWFREGAAAFGAAAERLRDDDVGESTQTREIALGLASGIQSFFLRYLGRGKRATPLVEESVSLLRRYGARRELAMGLFVAHFGYAGDDPTVRLLKEEMLVISQGTGFYLGQALALRGLGRNVEALEMAREAGDLRGMAFALMHLGEDAHRRQAYAQARTLYEESLTLAQEIGILWLVGQLQTYLGDVAMAEGEHDAARERYQEALAQSRLIHRELAILQAENGLGRVALATHSNEAAVWHYRQAVEIAVETRFDLMLREDPLRLELVAGVAALLVGTDEERAVELAALAVHHPASTEETRDRAQKLIHGLQGRLDASILAAAVERGRSGDLRSTIRKLLEEISV